MIEILNVVIYSLKYFNEIYFWVFVFLLDGMYNFFFYWVFCEVGCEYLMFKLSCRWIV